MWRFIESRTTTTTFRGLFPFVSMVDLLAPSEQRRLRGFLRGAIVRAHAKGYDTRRPRVDPPS